MSSAGVAVSLIHSDSFVLPPPFIPPPAGDSILSYVSRAGSLMPLLILESASIESVKLRIQTSQGFIVKKQRLVCGGCVLSRNDSLVKQRIARKSKGYANPDEQEVVYNGERLDDRRISQNRSREFNSRAP